MNASTSRFSSPLAEASGDLMVNCPAARLSRQLAVDESLIGYLVTRIERSFAAARAAVEVLDREALRLKRPVTRALAAELLSQA